MNKHKFIIDELLIGSIFGLSFIPVFGFIAIGISIFMALFWAMSGAGYSKLWRRLGCPILPIMMSYMIYHNPRVWVSLPIAFGILSLGYGIPSTQPPDKGSQLGGFFLSFCADNEWWANVCTRLTIYVLLGLSMGIVYMTR